MRRLISVSSILAAAGLLVACTTEPPPASVEERAQARWDAMVERDFGGVWELQAPGFRETTPRDEFVADMSRRPIRYHSARVAGSDCPDEDRCTVRVAVEYQPIGGPANISQMRMTRTIRERWIRPDGQWWHVAE